MKGNASLDERREPVARVNAFASQIRKLKQFRVRRYFRYQLTDEIGDVFGIGRRRWRRRVSRRALPLQSSAIIFVAAASGSPASGSSGGAEVRGTEGQQLGLAGTAPPCRSGA